MTEPGQLSAAFKEKRYFTVTGAEVVLIKVSLMVGELPVPAALLIPATAARVQLKAVPTLVLVAV